MPAINIRDMQEKDTGRVWCMYAGDWQQFIKGKSREEVYEQDINFLDHLDNRVKAHQALVAEFAGDIQGYSTSCMGSKYLTLINLFVNKTVRGLGIGRRLVEENARMALNHGFNRMRLQLPFVGEDEAKQFYLRLGFRELGEYAMQHTNLSRLIKFAANPGNYVCQSREDSEIIYFTSPTRIEVKSGCKFC